MEIKSAADFRAWISKIEAETSLSPSEIARAAGISESTVTRRVRADSAGVPRKSTIAKINRRFGHGTARRPGVNEDTAPFDHALKSEAEAMGLDPDAIARKAVEAAIKQKRFEAWLDENKQAFAAHRKDIEDNGLWSDGRRAF